ncbi:MAG: DUF1800 domain-containing protein, partial [Rhodothermales bacterium]|nr:DUF1800 domain-containing protein [Rhodothermales bacterium]
RPGDVDRVVALGLERWLDQQLHAELPSRDLDAALATLPALAMSTTEIAQTYPNPGRVLRLAAREQGLSLEGIQQLPEPERRRMLRAYRDRHGLEPPRALVAQLLAQKLARAVYSPNQLHEVLTDFWFNHFNVSLEDNQARPYVLAYERDAIRPHARGAFRALLGATARHPAMLHYLDNAQSTAPSGARTTMDARLDAFEQQPGLRGRIARRRIAEGRRRMKQEQARAMEQVPEALRPRRGVNENYARELLELHTLGVDGGYTQHDVEAVARAFTGWSVVPPGERADRLRARVEREGHRAGFVLEDAFLFRADVHDAGAKTLLGEPFAEGGGLEEGERVLDLVAAHPATARHLARKLAIRFVSDDPPAALVDTLATVFAETGGDVPALMRALAYAPAFWEAAHTQRKVKSPFELAVSAVRALGADFRPSRALIEWIDRMGQPLYRYAAPTGFPDAAAHWINAGALLHRMQFALALADNRVDGVQVDLDVIDESHEPESMAAALAAYAPLLMPEQDVDLGALLPLASEPAPPATTGGHDAARIPAQAVGTLLGSPAFQRR